MLGARGSDSQVLLPLLCVSGAPRQESAAWFKKQSITVDNDPFQLPHSWLRMCSGPFGQLFGGFEGVARGFSKPLGFPSQIPVKSLLDDNSQGS